MHFSLFIIRMIQQMYLYPRRRHVCVHLGNQRLVVIFFVDSTVKGNNLLYNKQYFNIRHLRDNNNCLIAILSARLAMESVATTDQPPGQWPQS
jgi:hypothetical protein